MKTIMFFGDSNTWGYDPVSSRRYPETVRFTGLIDASLSDCKVIEEGLKGRTNAWDDPLEEGRNGHAVLPILLCTHDPIDVFVIMLGTNDTKRTFNISAAEIAKGLEKNIQIVQDPERWGGEKTPKILVVCPVEVTEDYTGSEMEGEFCEHSVSVSKQFDVEYQKIANAYGCEYLNAQQYTKPSTVDGVHLDEAGHKKLAAALIEKLKEML